MSYLFPALRGRQRPGASGAAGAEAARRDGGGGRGGGGPYGRRQLEDAGVAGSHQTFSFENCCSLA